MKAQVCGHSPSPRLQLLHMCLICPEIMKGVLLLLGAAGCGSRARATLNALRLRGFSADMSAEDGSSRARAASRDAIEAVNGTLCPRYGSKNAQPLPETERRGSGAAARAPSRRSARPSQRLNLRRQPRKWPTCVRWSTVYTQIGRAHV